MDVDKQARIIWDYMQLNQELQKAEAIFVLCSLDTRVAEYAAKLYLDGYADSIIISGGFGELTKDRFAKPEAEVFADIITRAGVPKEKLIIENLSTNTGENVRFTYNLLKAHERAFIVHPRPEALHGAAHSRYI